MAELVWTSPENEPLKDIAGPLAEWMVWDQGLRRERLPRREDIAVFVSEDNNGEIRLRTEDPTLGLPSLEDALVVYDGNSDAFKLKLQQLRFVKATAGTLKETQALFGMLAHRIKKLEQAADPQKLAASTGYASFAAAKTETLNTIFALDSANFYDNLLH